MKTMGYRTGISLGGAVAIAVLVAGVAHAMALRQEPMHERLMSVATAEQLFADAPDGVDPVVTGPVSVSFKRQQADAGCDKATWPNIPLACYPR